MRLAWAALAAAFLVFASPARAEVSGSAPGGFLIEAQTNIAASPEAVWQALGDVAHWWSEAHSYSGDAANLRLEPRAGGCFCEVWADGSVEHMRVVLAIQRDEARVLRLSGGLGPLQGWAASGMLTFTITPSANGANLSMSYRVWGDPGLHLDQIAPVVDGVLAEQFARLVRLSVTGTP